MNMTNTEAVMLCRYAKACCPQQQFDEFTPDAWWDLLNDLDYEACKKALADVAKQQPFVSPSEIRGQIKRTRDDRMMRHGLLLDENRPRGWSDDRAEMTWDREVRKLIADGKVTCSEDIPQWTEAEMATLHRVPVAGELVPKPGDWDFNPADPRTFQEDTWMRQKPKSQAGMASMRSAMREAIPEQPPTPDQGVPQRAAVPHTDEEES